MILIKCSCCEKEEKFSTFMSTYMICKDCSTPICKDCDFRYFWRTYYCDKCFIRVKKKTDKKYGWET